MDRMRYATRLDSTDARIKDTILYNRLKLDLKDLI